VLLMGKETRCRAGMSVLDTDERQNGGAYMRSQEKRRRTHMRLSMNSSLLHIVQPCCYWEFQDYLYDLESREEEYREERANEVIDVPEMGQPWLRGLAAKFFGKVALTSIRRMDLPEYHPEYQGLEECRLDWAKAREIIARCWLETLEAWIVDRYYMEGITQDRIAVLFKDTWSPREYNFEHDECGFFLSASMEALSHIVEKCLVEYREGFTAYLKRAHSSYDGYISFMSNDVQDYDRYWERIKVGVSGFLVVRY